MPGNPLPITPPARRDGEPRQTVRVDTGASRYDIVIGRGLLTDPAIWAGLPAAHHAVIVSNQTVAPIFAAALQSALAPHYKQVSLLALPDGEQHKGFETLNLIFDHLLQRACDRQTVLFALGGGVVGDMTGFAAGCYMRGVPFVQVPTTLLAQVDSSVGGKTAINHALGKNMIGLFYQPQLVVCDLDTLATLPQRELVAGLAEVIKYGPIADADFLAWIESNLDHLLAREPQALAHAIRRSCEIKAQVVSADEREGGLRAILNFGHTFGHAIEAGMGYGAWLHGEAVGCGMLMAADLSARLGAIGGATGGAMGGAIGGAISDDDVERLRQLLVRAGLPTKAPDLGLRRYLELMGRDKKALGGQMRFVVLDGIGRASMRAAPDDVVAGVIERATRG